MPMPQDSNGNRGMCEATELGSTSSVGDLQNAALASDISFKAFLGSAPDAIIVMDDKGNLVSVNQLVEQMFGYQAGELLGQSVEQLASEVSRRNLMASVQRCLAASDESWERPTQVITGLMKSGVEFPAEIRLSLLKTSNATLMIGIVRDLTHLLRTESKFRGFLESAPDAVVAVDRGGRIVIVNSLTEKMFGYSRDELLSQPVEILVPERFRHSHVRDREGYSKSPRTRPMGAGQDLWGRRKDGSEFPVEISLSPLETEQGTLVTSIIRDTTERRDTEERIKASLREKEVLLKEIHHRVKNNLQVTSSLLKLQSGYIQDKQALEMFGDSQNRIRSMALVHEKLYQSSDLSRVDFSEYVESLAALLFRSYGVDSTVIKLRIQAEKAFLSIETAVPCGLIANELLSNCLKHAFPDKRPGEIRIRIFEDGNFLILSVADNGVGLPKGLEITKTESLGLQLVRTLTRQISGQLQVISQDWTEFQVRFPHQSDFASGTQRTSPSEKNAPNQNTHS